MRPCVLSIVIVSFNTRDLLQRCLLSIVDSPHHAVVSGVGGRDEGVSPHPTPHTPHLATIPVQVIVVDNASVDGSAEMVAANFPQVRLVRSRGNRGFARATNLGLSTSEGDSLLLNPDTEVIGDALVQMAAFLDAHPETAAVGPSLWYPNGSPQHAAFRFPTHWMTLLDFFPINHRLLNSPINGRYMVPADSSPFPVDHVLGAAMMIRREALKAVGPLDESFFMYCEEVDWCIRARRQDWQIYQVPSARVIHHSGKSTSQFREEMFVELWRSRYHLYDKHYSKGFVRMHRHLVRAGLARKSVEARWDAMRGRITTSQLQQRLRAYSAVWSM